MSLTTWDIELSHSRATCSKLFMIGNPASRRFSFSIASFLAAFVVFLVLLGSVPLAILVRASSALRLASANPVAG
jgi:hypothetical protein